VTESYDKSAAVVVLPSVSSGRLQDDKLRGWLSRAAIEAMTGPTEWLASVLHVLGYRCPEEGCAALRMWGQTGDRPTVWIAAADPVYLELRLDHLCLHALRGAGVPTSDLRALIDHLQRTLAPDSDFSFARVASYGYLRAEQAIPTASLPAYAIDQRVPSEFMPSGEEAARYRTLISEVEMALHEHDVNKRREEAGQQPVNSLWFWGGGYAPEQQAMPHPPLFADDPLLRGYWYSMTGAVDRWPGSIGNCLSASAAGFVAVAPEFEDHDGAMESWLHELREALHSGRLSRLTLLFRDGIRADVERSHALRFWRRGSRLLE
jgi:hypothetical protein